jgi:DNA-binding MarR family transcriptional regulator
VERSPVSSHDEDQAGPRAEAIRKLTVAGRRLSDATVLFHTKAAEAFGLGASETKALGFIQRFGPMTHRDLTERIGLKPASVTNILDRLEAKGWVRRQRSDEDGRRVLLTVVPEKVDAFRQKVFGPFMMRLEGVYAAFGTEELTLIARAFDSIAAAQEAAARDLYDHPSGTGE